MKTLHDIAKLDPKAQELLEAAGYFDISSFEGSSLNEITDEIVKANHALEIVEIDPTPGVVKQWLEPLKEEIGDLEGLVETKKERDLVSSKELLAASFAIPLTRAFIEANDIEVDQLLSGRVRYLADDVSDKVPEPEEEEIVEDEVFTIVEQMPEIPGGIQKYLAQNVKFPPAAKANGISGRVFINFTVGKDGKIRDVKILRGVHDLLDKEAVRVVKAMPKWKPGKQRGKAVSVSYNLPISFQLK